MTLIPTGTFLPTFFCGLFRLYDLVEIVEIDHRAVGKGGLERFQRLVRSVVDYPVTRNTEASCLLVFEIGHDLSRLTFLVQDRTDRTQVVCLVRPAHLRFRVLAGEIRINFPVSISDHPLAQDENGRPELIGEPAYGDSFDVLPVAFVVCHAEFVHHSGRLPFYVGFNVFFFHFFTSPDSPYVLICSKSDMSFISSLVYLIISLPLL